MRTFSFETLRTTGFALYGGADLGEVLVTARSIREGDEASWHQAWRATAQRVAENGHRALASGHRVSAREALLRASNYYRTAAAFLLEKPATDPEDALLSTGQHDTFEAAAALFDTPVEAVSIAYEDTTLPAYLFLVDDSGTARPTIIYNSGYDSTREGVLLCDRRRRVAPRIQRPRVRRPRAGCRAGASRNWSCARIGRPSSRRSSTMR